MEPYLMLHCHRGITGGGGGGFRVFCPLVFSGALVCSVIILCVCVGGGGGGAIPNATLSPGKGGGCSKRSVRWFSLELWCVPSSYFASPRPAQLTRRLVDFIWRGPELPNTGCCETCLNASCLGRGSPLDGGKIRDGGRKGEGGIPNATLSPSEVCVCVCVGGILCTKGGRGATTLSPPEVCVCVGRGILCTMWGGGGGTIPNATPSPLGGGLNDT